MDVSRPITAVVPSLEGPVLEALARTSRPLTGREVHRLTGAGSPSGVRLVLQRLVEHGLVTATEAGRATLYLANRDHIAWPAVQALTDLRQRLFTRIRDLAASWAVAPVTVAVFGSTARGDGGTDSDIDVLLVHVEKDDDAWQSQVDDLREKVMAWTGNGCHTYDLTESEFNAHVTTEEPIVDEWRREAVLVFGAPLQRLIERGLS